jgi:quercetin dioxygenase-like cupin family protein
MRARITIGLWISLAILIAATQLTRESSGSPAVMPLAQATPAMASSPAPVLVTRSILVEATPVAAPDRSLQLVRYVIEPGAKLPAHTHPGTQIAWIESGELTYTVVDGEIPVQRGTADGVPDVTEVIVSGQTTVLKPGDAVVEHEDMVHFGENRGEVPVVILASTLLVAGEPPATIEQE